MDFLLRTRRGLMIRWDGSVERTFATGHIYSITARPGDSSQSVLFRVDNGHIVDNDDRLDSGALRCVRGMVSRQDRFVGLVGTGSALGESVSS